MRYPWGSPRRLLVMLADMVTFGGSYYLAFLLRLDDVRLAGFGGVFLSTLPYAVLLESIGMQLAGAYRGIWKYSSINDLWNIINGAFYGSIGLVLVVVFSRGTHGYPRSVFLINFLLVVLGMGGNRFLWRLYRDMLKSTTPKKNKKAVIVVGAGDAAENLIRELQHNPRMSMRPVGIVDDARDKMAQAIHGVPILGTVEDLPRLAKDKAAEEILIAIPSASGAQMRRIVGFCRESRVPHRTVPGTGDILDGKVRIHHLRQVKVEDLLRRPPVRLDNEAISTHLGGKRVLVTGAGGSIGSEICAQVARFSPAEVIFLDHSENGLFYLADRFKRQFPGVRHRSLVADITRRGLMEGIMHRARPEVVFHAAAHKHVPLMEENVIEAFFNNVVGTRIAAETAALAQAEKFVMISTDKAVNPSSVMGLSKRIAEIIVEEMNREKKPTEFVTVRFGNVMGSEGSVVPIFARQIEMGGPVTVTHPEVVRYFMTIPEAAQLVLQASSIGKGGEVLILNMGEPIKVLDLAREMITLSGLEPDVDIEIKITSLRPGEKLYEELITEGEMVMPTLHEKIMVFHSRQGMFDPSMAAKLRQLEDLVHQSAPPDNILEMARELVPEYDPEKNGRPTGLR